MEVRFAGTCPSEGSIYNVTGANVYATFTSGDYGSPFGAATTYAALVDGGSSHADALGAVDGF